MYRENGNMYNTWNSKHWCVDTKRIPVFSFMWAPSFVSMHERRVCVCAHTDLQGFE